MRNPSRRVSSLRRPTFPVRAIAVIGVIAGLVALIVTLPSLAATTSAGPPKSDASAAPNASATRPQPQIAKTQEEWRGALQRLPKPRTGCHTASFPRVEWKAIPCVTPPPYPLPPKPGPAAHFIVGGGGANDFSARPASAISASEGTFVSLSPAAITEAGQVNATGPQVTNAYTLQLNTNQFTDAVACMGSPNPGCKGWEQFVYTNDNNFHVAFIQYWIIRFNKPCPAGGWTQFSFPMSTDIYCFRNSTGGASLPAGQPASNLKNMILGGSVSAGADSVTLTLSGTPFTAAGNAFVHPSGVWTDAEFNIFGDAGGGQANMGANSTMTVKTTVHNGTKLAPSCQSESFTGETNNLTLVGAPTVTTTAAPSIEFTQSNVAGGSPASCATATGIGDVHMTTFGGLLYDFQASGDFVMIQTGSQAGPATGPATARRTSPAFIVQERQVSGAPNWPSATVNKAVATQMGKTQVALCLAPSRLMIDGAPANVGDGQTLSLPSGVGVRRVGNVYLVVDQSGNSMRAVDNGAYIDLTVGLGRWPTRITGVLANANGNVNQIAARTGAVLTSPFPFVPLYHQFADSWRVPAATSLLSVCGRQTAVGVPSKPFYAADLAPDVAKRVSTICTGAGVKNKALLDACMIDVAFTGSEKAAKVYVGMHAPAAVGKVVVTRGGGYGGGDTGGDTDRKKE